MPKTYRVCIIGRTGRGNYGHNLDTAWRTHPRAEIVGVADDNPEGLKKAGERLSVNALYPDYRRMLGELKPDFAVVAPRWTDCHLAMVLAAAEVRASIFMEKPMAPSLVECDRMIDACDRAHVKISVAHNMRTCPIVDYAEQKLKDGLIGDLQEIRGRGKEDRRAGGEDMMVLGTHVFDLMRRFAGDPEWVFGRVCAAGHELRKPDVNPNGAEGLGYLGGDNIAVMYGFPGGLAGYFASKRSSEVSGVRFGVDLYGSKGVMAIRAAHVPEIWISSSTRWAGDAWQRLAIPPGTGPRSEREAYHIMIDDLIDAIEKDREPAAGGRGARWTVEMAMGAYASYKAGARVRLPLAAREHPLSA